MRPDVRPLNEALAHLDPIATEHRIADLHHWTSVREVEEWEANWKLVVSNAMESYHLFKVHPETLEPFTPTADAYYFSGSADGTATGGSQQGDSDYVLISLPPNFVGVISGRSFVYQVVEPVTASRSRIVAGGAFESKDPAKVGTLAGFLSMATSRLSESMLPDFLPEDKWICERGQRAATGDFDPGTIVPMEQVIVDFHHYLNRQLHDVTPPPVTTSATVGIAKGPTTKETTS